MEFSLISLLALLFVQDINTWVKTPTREIGEEMNRKRTIHNIEMIKQSVRKALKIPGHEFTRDDIIRCASAANWQGKTKNTEMVGIALKEMGLDDLE